MRKLIYLMNEWKNEWNNEWMNKMKATLNRFKFPAKREISTNKKIIFKKNFLMFFFYLLSNFLL